MCGSKKNRLQRYTLHITFSVLCILAILPCALAQRMNKEDSVGLRQLHFSRNKFINNIFRQTVNSVERAPEDDNPRKGKSEDPYLPYQGKIIRHIYVVPLNFDRSFPDTSKADNGLATRVGRALHTTTRPFVLRNNLFIQENTPLNAFKLADNERFLRGLEYIHDARIKVLTIPDNPDSVDIRVMTTDLFSIAGGAAIQGTQHMDGNIYETNLGGMAQRIEFSGLYDQYRTPTQGYGALYRKDNVGHSFIDATIAYSKINFNPYTHEQDNAESFTLNRQLISPYSRFAGQLSISHNEANNVYNLPESKIYFTDSVFFKYKYNYIDAWAGYNIGIKQLTATNNSIRDRRFLAIRVYDRDFSKTPLQVGNGFDPVFNSSRAALAQLTFFRQDYYKTQYIYGFGTTEDFPYGYNVAVTAGWHQQLNLQRPYVGFNATRYIATGYGDFIQLFLRSGGFLHDNKVQDGSFLVGATAFSRLFFINSTKIREYVNASYTHLYNRVTYAPLRIDNYYGLRGFLSDSAYGSRRLSIQLETEFYLKPKILGFQFAPFPYSDFTIITPEKGPYNKSNLYTSLGGGIRARNERLVFETIELRAYFFPIAPTNMKGFKIILTTNVRFRYSSNYVTAPDFVQLNSQ